MNKYVKYSILLTLGVLLASGLVNAISVPIGQSPQWQPVESVPSTSEWFMIGGTDLGSRGNMMDGDPSTSGTFSLLAPHILRPNGNGNYQSANWLTGPDAGVGYIAWRDEIADDAGSFYYITTGASQRVSSTLADPPAGATGAITGVTVYFRACRTSTATTSITPFLRLNGVDLSGTAQSITTGANVWSTFSRVIGRPGTGTWSWADIASLEVGMLSAATAGTPRVTQIYIAVAGPTAGYFDFSGFMAPGTIQFTPGWVDFKVKWSSPATVDDQYRIVYRVDPDTTWNVLKDWNPTGADAEATVGDQTLARTFSMKAEPNDGIWDWTDIGNVKIRIETLQVGTNDGATISWFDSWVQVSPNPPPPTDVGGGTAISVQPSYIGLLAGQSFFVDIYVRDLPIPPGLSTYGITLLYDPNILTATEFWTYAPIVNMLPSGIDDTAGSVGIAAITFLGDTVGYTEANFPVCRIYFTVDADGTSPLDLTFGELKQVGIDPIYPPIFDGVFNSPRVWSRDEGVSTADPTNKAFRELYPTLDTSHTVSSWIDNGDGVLSASDSIATGAGPDMQWYHVDIVTITIHFTMLPPDAGTGEAEPTLAVTEMPAGDPSFTTWRMIIPTYSRTFTITGFTDNDGDTNFNPSDQFSFAFDDAPETTLNAHLDSVTTDIWVSTSPPPTGEVPEFPLGIGLLMSLIALIPVVYLWRTRPQKKVK